MKLQILSVIRSGLTCAGMFLICQTSYAQNCNLPPSDPACTASCLYQPVTGFRMTAPNNNKNLVTFTPYCGSNPCSQDQLNKMHFLWDFRDGAYSNSPTPTHIYLLKTNYSPILRVSNIYDESDGAYTTPSLPPCLDTVAVDTMNYNPGKKGASNYTTGVYIIPGEGVLSGYPVGYLLTLHNSSASAPATITGEFTFDRNLSNISHNGQPYWLEHRGSPNEITWDATSRKFLLSKVLDPDAAVSYFFLFKAADSLEGLDSLYVNFNGKINDANYQARNGNPIKDSWDPNRKTGYRKVWAGDWMEYTVHFENLGDAHARMVEIRDVINPPLNIDSVIFLESSPVQFAMATQGNQLLFTSPQGFVLPVFDPENFYANKGYVRFKVKLDEGVKTGFLQNSADIIFDQNPPVHTNTVRTVIQMATKTTDPTDILRDDHTASGQGETWKMLLLVFGILGTTGLLGWLIGKSRKD